MEDDNGINAADSGPKLVGKGNPASHGKQCADAMTTESMGSGLNKQKQGSVANINNKVSSPVSKEKVGKPVTPLQASKRSAAVADQNSLERASKLKAKINLDGSPDQGKDFLWHCKSPEGRSGGMLVGVNLATLDVGSIEEGDFFVRFKIRCKKHDFISNLVLEDHKQRFLKELAHLSSKETLPMIIGGDFNIMRGPQEKSKVIDAYNLRELELSGRQFTWANNLSNQTFEKLDRILVTTEWETKYPKATVQTLTREISDHTPLFLNSGDEDSTPPHSDFKFELGWLLREGFFDMVKDVWSSIDVGSSPLDRWQAKIRKLRQYLRGWAKNTGGVYKREKKLLLEKLDELDKKSEHTQLDNDELNLKHAMHERVSQLLREVEIKWYQRAKMEHNKAPGPDGFPPEFYQVFWNVIKTDFMALFDEFHRGNLTIDRLNFGNIILIPKVGDASKIQQYRPICLLNVSFKIFTKVATNRIAKVAHKIIRPSQTAFLPGRNIMEGAVVLHETLHELHRKNLNGVIFKIDFEKAYDKGNVAVNINGQNGSYFQARKGLRQGDLLSPILLNIVADMLAIIINRTKSEGKVNGVIPYLVEDGLSILQYADDTVIFLDHDLEKARNMKVLLCLFEKLSGLKINFHKSEIFCFGQAKECENDYSELFGCRLGSFPFRYLGLPMHYRKLRNSDWRHIEERFEKRLIGWKGKLLSVGGRLVLINSVLSSLPMFMLSFFAIPKGHKKKYHLIKWDQIRQPKEQGGLKIIDLEAQNKCLLSKWLFKLANEDGIWQTILRNKYLKSKPFGSGTKRPGVSHFWAGLMDVKQDFISLGSFQIRDGSQVRFWEDTWCGNQPLKNIYPSLFNIVRKKGATVADVMSSIPLNVSFRRGLYGERLHVWNELVGRIMNLELREERDVFKWGLNKTGVFTVRLMYKYLINKGIRVSQEIWQTKIPLKTKIFMWYVKRGAAALIWTIWLQRNDAVFDRKQPKNFLQILFRGTFWLRHWAKLQRSDDLVQWLTQGAHNLEVAALRVFASFG
ncbi:hypothetical protein U9M48_004664, partial [Paspalum notatum var. saurae]